MGGGSTWHLTANDDSNNRIKRARLEIESPWSAFSSGLEETTGIAEVSSGEELARGLRVAVETSDGINSIQGSRGPDISCDMKSEARTDFVVFQDIRQSENVASDFQISPLAPTTAPVFQPIGVSLLPARKRIFKLMQIENDNQDLSFVEKVIFCRDEIFRLCNDITEGSARTSDDKRTIIDFGVLNSKSMKVIGCFGSKDIMREFFQNSKVMEQCWDVWTQIQNDTLAPGLYAVLRIYSVFVFYWHQGHFLPVASRKDMSCNFIRYLFDLCDSVYICLDDRNVKNCVFESSSRFSKHRRTQRLQISLVKASEDSIKMKAGFFLEGLCLRPGNELPSDATERRNAPSSLTFGHDYRLTEGRNRIALLASSTRPRKLTSVKKTDSMNANDFPAFINKWTVDCDYRMDVKNLSNSDFVVFIRCAKLVQADEYDRLLACNEKKKEMERKKLYDVDKLVEEAQEQLSCYLESFLYGLLRYNYPSWEEKLTALENSCAASIECQSLSGEAPHQKKAAEWNELSAEKVAHELNRLEEKIYGLLFGENSEQRIIFPTSLFTLSQDSQEGGKQKLWAIASSCSENSSSKISQAFYGQMVSVKCVNDSTVALKSGKVHRCTASNDDGPLLSDEEMTFSFDSSWKRVKLVPGSRNGLLREWLDHEQTEFHKISKRAALLTALLEELVKLGFEFDLTEELACQTLASEDPLNVLAPFLLPFAQIRWEELQNSKGVPELSFSEFLNTLCMDKYQSFRQDIRSRISYIERYSTSLLNRKIRKQCKESCERLEAALQKEEAAFLFSQKDLLSKNGSTGLLKISVESCCVIERSLWRSSLLTKKFMRSDEGGKKISITYSREEFEKESITWHGFELAPMKEDLDQLVLDNDYTFRPTCSPSKEIIDLDPRSQVLLRVVFLNSGQLLVFVIEGHSDPKNLVIYLCPKLGVKVSDKNIIKTLRRGFDLVAFDERSRFIALYESSISTIKTFRFDEAFLHMDWTGVDNNLGEYCSIGRVVWMDFVTGKNEIVFIDDLHRVRLCEVNQPGMVRSGNVHVGQTPIVKASVTTQGSCLLLLRNAKRIDAECDVEGPEGLDNESARDSWDPSTDRTNTEDWKVASLPSEEQDLTMDVYKLIDSLEHFSSIRLDMNVKDNSKLVVGLVSFSSQMHLVLFDSQSPSSLRSQVIKISSASEVCELQQVTQPDEVAEIEPDAASMQCGPVLDFIYHIFEKYATSPPLSEHPRDLHLGLVLKGLGATPWNATVSDKCSEYIRTSLDTLKRDKGKDFSALWIRLAAYDVERFQLNGYLPSSMEERSSTGLEVQMGVWMRRLICLVPIQIARAEQNALKPLVNGLQLSGNVDYADAISLANVIRFGLYESIFDSWKGPIKVISSMGKQSSGKSYLLNHLSGSLLDVAGGRCTDGVWMTLREGDGCLYVLLDFEGLGSFERSEQEDMLLSLLNAAVSNVTIFNKKDFHLDKETEAIFERFRNGVSLVKTDAKLFRGLFYMAIKDVDISDVDDLKKEFFSKICQICRKSQDNFLTRMYGGAVEISAMPSFNRPEFHESVLDIARTVEKVDASYLSGRSFLLDLKLIMAQITTKDWSPIDSKRVALRINLLRKHLKNAISVGCFVSEGISKPLIQFDDYVNISDEPVVVHDIDFLVSDTGLELSAFWEKRVTGDILFNLMGRFKTFVCRKGEKDEEWHSFFENFVNALVLRRKRRVLDWIARNTSEFPNDGDIQKLQFEAVALLAEVQQNLLLCSCKCERCFLRCVQEKGHPSGHTCMGDHRCVALCTYCVDEESALSGPCNDAAGHDGPHDCQEKSHTCGKACTYAATSSNCNGNCSKKCGHSGDHQCNSRQHICNQVCSLPFCKNPCVSPIDFGDHERHACHEKFCPLRCTMKGCNRTCAAEDHFHGKDPDVTRHLCGAEHACSGYCEYKGNCEVLTEVSKKTQTFTGRRATFDYLLVSEQNGNRKGCCIVIPPYEDRHDGPHSHRSNPDAVHFCETRCPSCGYFCNRPIEPGGLHNTTHGNMRDVNFVAESEEIDILDRKYAWGESGVAEMCQMHCKAQGRGHTHLIYCPANKRDGTCRKLFDGSQHEVRKYGPDFDTPKDEMTHSAFWEYVRFEDPCGTEEQKQFALCNHQCKSDEHNPASGGVAQNISYCTECVWHQPVPKTDMIKFGTGYITDDGHHFSCDHSTNVAVNVIFIIDRSSSMGLRDIRPTMMKFSANHDDRLGCVYEAILRFIRTRLSSVQDDIASVILFNHGAQTVIQLQELKESLVDNLLHHHSSGCTIYSSGLQNAEDILSLAASDPLLSRKSPVIIFLSDGGNNGGSDPLVHIRAMKALDPKLQLHTVMFGNDPSRKILEDMAQAGDGTFEVSLDEVQLSRRFEGLAKSLRPKVVSLL